MPSVMPDPAIRHPAVRVCELKDGRHMCWFNWVSRATDLALQDPGGYDVASLVWIKAGVTGGWIQGEQEISTEGGTPLGSIARCRLNLTPLYHLR